MGNTVDSFIFVGDDFRELAEIEMCVDI